MNADELERATPGTEGHDAGHAPRSPSEGYWHDLLQHAVDAFALTDAGGNLMEVSETCARLVGLSRPELLRLGRLDALAHPDDVAAIGATWDAALAAPLVAQAVEARLRHREGSHRRVALRVVNLLSDPVVGQVLVVAHDVTALRGAEQRAATSGRLLEEIFREAYEGIALVDAEGRIVLCNPAITEMFGYQPAELVGQPVEILVPEAASATHATHVQAFVRGDVARRPMGARPVLEARRRDGTTFPVQITLSKFDLGGEPFVSAFVRDVTDWQRAEEQRRAEHRRFRALVEHAGEVIALVDPEGTLRWASASTARVFGYEVGHPPHWPIRLTELSHPEDIALVEQKFAEVLASPGRAIAWESRGRRADGTYRWFSTTATNLLDDPAVGGIVINASDITARHEQVERQEHLLRLGRLGLERHPAERVAAEAASVLAFTLEADLVVCARLAAGGTLACHVLAGDAGSEVTLSPRDDPWAEVLASDAPVRLGEPEGSGGVEPAARVTEALFGTTSGLLVRLAVAGEPVGFLGVLSRERRHWDPSEASFLGVCANVLSAVLESERAEAELEHHSLHDPLTGLPNRVLLGDRIGQALRRGERLGSSVALLLFDVDDFKTVNDSLGHTVGDALLRMLAARVSGVLRSSDTLVRLGGDEFVVLCDDAHGSPDAVWAVAERILEATRQPFVIGMREVFVTVSIGIVVAEASTVVDAGGLIADADLAMYQAKRRGGDQAVAFDQDLRARVDRRLHLARDLHRALEECQFEVAYQPKMELATGRIAAVEALVRWRHPQLGLLAPESFLQTAEEIGVIVGLGEWVLAQVLEQARRFAERFGEHAPEPIWVNLSRRELLHPGLVEAVAAALEHASVGGHRLGFEVTEHAFIDDLEAARETLVALRDLGVHVCLDDFGVGYSSLTYLHQLPVECLKIDRSFVERLGSDEQTARIVRSVVDMAHDLGLRVTAEGVETQGQSEMVSALGCDFAQGYLFGPPGPAERIDRMISDRLGAGA